MNPHRLPSGPPGPEAAGAVLVSQDRPLVDHVVALADAAGAPLEVVPLPSAVPRGARLVLIGLDAAADLRRPGSVLVVRVEGADPPDGVWRQAVHLGAEHVAVLPEGEAWLIERLLDVSGPVRQAPTVGVVGGCGGAGASSVAISLAVTAAGHGMRPVLIDTDPFGGGLDLPLGADGVPGRRWPDLPWSSGRLPAGVIEEELPEVEGVRVLTGPRGQATTTSVQEVSAVLDAAARESDLVVVDLPRRVGDVEAAVLPRCQLVLLVVPGRVRGVASGGQLAAALELHAGDVRVVVREPLAPGLDPETVADALLLPLAGHLGPEPRLAAALDGGEAAALPRRGPLANLSRHLLANLLGPA